MRVRKRQKLFRFEVDQSVRIEEMNRASFVGLANKEYSFVVKISARTKRQLKEHFRRNGRLKQYAPLVFASLIIKIVNLVSFRVQDVVIDIEYPGYELKIQELLRHFSPEIKVYFASIGKKSPAHYAAYGVFIGKKKEDAAIKTQDVLHILKNGPRTVTHLDITKRFAAHSEPSNNDSTYD